MPRSLTDRLRGIMAELGKFIVVGGLCFIVDAGLAYFFRFHVGLGPTTSKGLATIVATALSYVGNRLWSFSHRVDENAGHGQDLTLYAGINAVGLAITLVPVDIAHYLLHETSGLAFNLSGALGTALATVFRFWAYRKWVFADEPDLAERAALV
ncbi:MAG: GtrA family protein [Frankiales bacterium]|nr:GtrA family protein [Frankiales bacterium]